MEVREPRNLRRKAGAGKGDLKAKGGRIQWGSRMG